MIVIEANMNNYMDIISEMKQKNARLVQICCTETDGYEITYSFDVDYDFTHIRLSIIYSQEIESISGMFDSAFLYENEMKDLFGVKIIHISPDFQGELYKLPKSAPFIGEP